MDNYGGKIKKIIYAITKDLSCVDEAFGCVCSSVWDHVDKMMSMDQKGMESYLNKIIRTSIADSYRGAKKNKNVVLTEIEELDGLAAGSGISDPEKHVIFMEYMDKIRTLDKINRDIVILRIFFGMPYKLIGRNLNLTEAAARKRYERSIKLLREE